MTAKGSLLSMWLLAAGPALALAILGVMGGISDPSSTFLMVLYYLAAALGTATVAGPLLMGLGMFKKGPAKPKAAAAVKAAPEKASKSKTAVVEESLSDEFAAADEFGADSEEFEAASDDDLEFGEADEFDDEKKA